jgi:hypothetical protein
MKIILIALVSFGLAACSQSAQTQTTWSSKHRKLSFTYTSPWQLLPGMESQEKTLAGVIDKTDGTSYLLQIGDDVSKERLTDSEYYEGARNTMLAANSNNRLVLEDDTIYHGMKAHRQVYVLEAKRWGTISHVTYIIRNEQEYLSVQISYPHSKQAVIGRLPENLARFDETVRVTVK